MAKKLKALAADYLAQAQLLESVTLPPPEPLAAAPMQQQQQIQPNSDTKNEEE